MENVDLQVREVEQEITQEQYDHYKKTGHFGSCSDNSNSFRESLLQCWMNFVMQMEFATTAFNQAYIWLYAEDNEMAKWCIEPQTHW